MWERRDRSSMRQEREEREQRHIGCSDRIYINQVRFPAPKQRLAGEFIHVDYIVITCRTWIVPSGPSTFWQCCTITGTTLPLCGWIVSCRGRKGPGTLIQLMALCDICAVTEFAWSTWGGVSRMLKRRTWGENSGWKSGLNWVFAPFCLYDLLHVSVITHVVLTQPCATSARPTVTFQLCILNCN